MPKREIWIEAKADVVPDWVDEADCPVCAYVDDKAEFREGLDAIPLSVEICKACLVAFFRNIGFPVSDDDPPLH